MYYQRTISSSPEIQRSIDRRCRLWNTMDPFSNHMSTWDVLWKLGRKHWMAKFTQSAIVGAMISDVDFLVPVCSGWKLFLCKVSKFFAHHQSIQFFLSYILRLDCLIKLHSDRFVIGVEIYQPVQSTPFSHCQNDFFVYMSFVDAIIRFDVYCCRTALYNRL